MADDEVYEVETLMETEWRRGKQFFLVKWKGYDESHNTWEPITMFDNREQTVLECWHAGPENAPSLKPPAKSPGSSGKAKSGASPSAARKKAPAAKAAQPAKTARKPGKSSKAPAASGGAEKGTPAAAEAAPPAGADTAAKPTPPAKPAGGSAGKPATSQRGTRSKGATPTAAAPATAAAPGPAAGADDLAELGLVSPVPTGPEEPSGSKAAKPQAAKPKAAKAAAAGSKRKAPEGPTDGTGADTAAGASPAKKPRGRMSVSGRRPAVSAKSPAARTTSLKAPQAKKAAPAAKPKRAPRMTLATKPLPRRAKPKSPAKGAAKEKAVESYEVEHILERKAKGGKYLYLVKWKGYAASENSWEPSTMFENIGAALKTCWNGVGSPPEAPFDKPPK